MMSNFEKMKRILGGSIYNTDERGIVPDVMKVRFPENNLRQMNKGWRTK